MAFVVVYDACVLFPNALRDILIRIGMRGVVRARWTNEILDETFSAIQEKKPDIPPESLQRTRELMNKSIRDCLVDGYQPLIGGLTLPDLNDRHVLAAAIACGAQTIVTANLKDFPEKDLRQFNIEAQHPDDFVMCQIDLNEGALIQIVSEQSAALKNPTKTVEQVLDGLLVSGLVQSVTRLRELLRG